MPFSILPRRAGVLLALTLFTSLLSCGREITAPGGRARLAEIAFAPRFETARPTSNPLALSVASLVPFEAVRVVLRRGDEIVVDRLVDFPVGDDTVALKVSVTVSPEAGSEGELLTATLDYLDADGTVVFTGEVSVRVIAGVNATAPVEVEIVYVGPGSDAVSVQITPDTIVANSGQTAALTAVAYDAQQAVVNNAVIGFIAEDPSKITIPNLAIGSAQLTGLRGGSWVYAELINGAYDSVWVEILPVPTAITKSSGDAQATLQATAFNQPLKVRLTAADGLGVADWPVSFAVTSGSGVLSAAEAITDADGYAEVTWTAGDVPGAASVTASVAAPALSAVFTGSQLSSGPSQLVFEVQPQNIVAGFSLPGISVSVRNGAGTPIEEYTGAVTLALDGGTATAALLGAVSVEAVGGVATFPGLTVNRGGTAYRLLASVEGVSGVPSAPFNVAAAPPAGIALVSGGGQSAPALTALTSPIVIEVIDQFEFVVPGVLVTFSVEQGGGSVTATSATTDANGRASTSWTLGAAGTQLLSASVGQVQPLQVGATLVGGEGPASLFAGFDYTYVPVGRHTEIPVYLSSSVATSTVVTLTTADSTASWTTSTVEIPAGQTSAVAVVAGDFTGQTMAYLASPLGNDSVLVYVDSTWVDLVELDYTYFNPGDTVRTQVWLGDPAPPGGVTVKVRSLNPSLALVAPGSGSGAPVPGCLTAQYCDYGNREDSNQLRLVSGRRSALLAPPADTALITIPEGQVYGQLVVLMVGENLDGVVATNLQVTAPGLVPGSTTYYQVLPSLSPSGSGNSLSAPMGLGQVMRARMYVGYGQPTKDRKITLRSVNPAVVTLDSVVVIPRLNSSSPQFELVAQGLGSTYVIYESPGVPTDSFPVTVANPRLLLEPQATYAAIHDRSYVLVHTTAEGQSNRFPRATDLPFRVFSTNPSVVVVEGEGRVVPAGAPSAAVDIRFVGSGTAYLKVEAAGHPPDSVQVNTYVPGFVSYSGPHQVGVGLQQDLQFGPSATATNGVTHTITVTSSDPSVVRVLTPTVEMSPSMPYPRVRFAGVAVGSANLEISGGGFATSQVAVQVTETSLLLSGVSASAWPDSLPRTVTSFLASGSYARAATDTVRARLRSSDPSVLWVVDSLVTFFPGESFASDVGRFSAVQPGSAQLTLHSAGLPDPPPVGVTVQPYQITASTSTAPVGVGIHQYGSVGRNSPTTATLPVSFTQEGVGAVSIRGTVAFSAGAGGASFNMEGVTAGAVSLIVQAAGHPPDTLFLTVNNTRIELRPYELYPSAGTMDEYVEVLMQVGESAGRRAPATPKNFVISSSDTTIAKVVQDTVRYEADSFYPSQYATVRYLRTGNVILTATDVDGLVAPATRAIFVEPATLSGGSYYSNDALVMGLNQRTYEYELYVERSDYMPEPLEITLTSSVPGFLDLPATVTIPAYERYAYFSVASGTTIGSARITASAPGWNPWQFNVFVTRTMLGVYAPDLYTGESEDVEIYFMDALTYNSRPMNVPVPLRLRSERPAVALASSDTIIVPAGEPYYMLENVITGLAIGRSQITVADTRTAVNDLVLEGSDEAEVHRPYLRFNTSRLLATPGIRSTASSQYLYVESPRDSLLVRFTSLGGRVSMPENLLLENYGGGGGYLEFEVEGVSAGLDSVVAEADGMAPDTVLVLVGPGVIRLVTLPTQTLVVGDSVLLSLRLVDQGGNNATLTAAQTIDFNPGGILSVRNGGAPITSTIVPSGLGTFAVWVRAESAGTSELTISGANFRTLRLTFTTRVVP